MPDSAFIIGISSPTRGQVVSNLTNGRFTVLPNSLKPSIFTGIFHVLNTGRDKSNNTYYIVRPYIPVELGSYLECVVNALNIGKRINPRYDLRQLAVALEALSVIDFEHQKEIVEAWEILQREYPCLERQDRPVVVEDIFGMFRFERVQHVLHFVIAGLSTDETGQQYAPLFKTVDLTYN